MIVKYIGKTTPLELTHGKEYEVLSVEQGWYRILDDSGEDYLYPHEFFTAMLENQQNGMIPCRVEYISDQKSIFFQKGYVYDGFIPQCSGGSGFFAFWFEEEEMDEAGYYALPAYHFMLISIGHKASAHRRVNECRTIIDQWRNNGITALTIDGTTPSKPYFRYMIENKVFEYVPVYDLPHCIAINEDGDFIGKLVFFIL